MEHWQLTPHGSCDGSNLFITDTFGQSLVLVQGSQSRTDRLALCVPEIMLSKQIVHILVK